MDLVEIEFHPRLTILTGANGAGKSTLLGLLSRHFGWSRHFLATPVRTSSGAILYEMGIFGPLSSRAEAIQGGQRSVGAIEYSNNADATLYVPQASAVSYDISLSSQPAITGLHIDSHRPPPFYQQVTQIPTNPMTAQVAYSNYDNEVRNRYQGGNSNVQPTFRIKEAIISMATFGEGNSSVQGNEDIVATYNGFKEILRRILPEEIGFLDISVRLPEVVLVTTSGEFILDAASGGLMTVIDIAWRLYTFSLDKTSFVITMDEPENHLHPLMQRTLVSRLVSAFPMAQFIIATHSPFVVTSVRDSNVFVLRFGDMFVDEAGISHRRVRSERLDTANKAGTANEVLRDVLGVGSTMPEWVEVELNAIVEKYRRADLSGEALGELRGELSELGFEDFYSDALAGIVRRP